VKDIERDVAEKEHRQRQGDGGALREIDCAAEGDGCEWGEIVEPGKILTAHAAGHNAIGYDDDQEGEGGEHGNRVAKFFGPGNGENLVGIENKLVRLLRGANPPRSSLRVLRQWIAGRNSVKIGNSCAAVTGYDSPICQSPVRRR
jgi:hypothetical protein